jgi:hypothetical protein
MTRRPPGGGGQGQTARRVGRGTRGQTEGGSLVAPARSALRAAVTSTCARKPRSPARRGPTHRLQLRWPPNRDPKYRTPCQEPACFYCILGGDTVDQIVGPPGTSTPSGSSSGLCSSSLLRPASARTTAMAWSSRWPWGPCAESNCIQVFHGPGLAPLPSPWFIMGQMPKGDAGGRSPLAQ